MAGGVEMCCQTVVSEVGGGRERKTACPWESERPSQQDLVWLCCVHTVLIGLCSSCLLLAATCWTLKRINYYYINSTNPYWQYRSAEAPLHHLRAAKHLKETFCASHGDVAWCHKVTELKVGQLTWYFMTSVFCGREELLLVRSIVLCFYVHKNWKV